MSPRAKKSSPPPTRGRGRPSLSDEGGETVPTMIRIAEGHFVELRRVIAHGHGTTIAGAIRWLIEESARTATERRSPGRSGGGEADDAG